MSGRSCLKLAFRNRLDGFLVIFGKSCRPKVVIIIEKTIKIAIDENSAKYALKAVFLRALI